MNLYEYSFLFAVVAVVYSTILTEPDHLLDWWYRFLHKKLKVDERRENGKGKPALFMLLVHCEKCIGGEIMFWSYLYMNWGIMYDVAEHLCFTALTILLAGLIKLTYKIIESKYE